MGAKPQAALIATNRQAIVVSPRAVHRHKQFDAISTSKLTIQSNFCVMKMSSGGPLPQKIVLAELCVYCVVSLRAPLASPLSEELSLGWYCLQQEKMAGRGGALSNSMIIDPGDDDGPNFYTPDMVKDPASDSLGVPEDVSELDVSYVF